MSALFLAFVSFVYERGREDWYIVKKKKKKLTNFALCRYKGLKYSTVFMFIKIFILSLFFMENVNYSL